MLHNFRNFYTAKKLCQAFFFFINFKQITLTVVNNPFESTIQILLRASSFVAPSSCMAITSRLAIPMEACINGETAELWAIKN